ncbi:MAG: L-2-amino-thiazoline-4-carboxylic acid hydrolase [Deltaproteobacteria bacterium]|nr:L-2-amino-thiazoline-4-carboxylic acid hydrolase [Deltaproteobacteria bacterium]
MLKDVGLQRQHEIEVRIMIPLITELIKVFGKEATLDVVRRSMADVGLAQGRQLREMADGDGIEDFARQLSLFSEGGAQEQEILAVSETRLDVNISKCVYAETCKKLGDTELGYELLCARDPYLFKGFNPRMKMNRTKTIMQGDECCDFRISLK